MNTETLLRLGRVVYVNYGPLSGKIAVVVDIINENRVVVDGPGLGVTRQAISIKRLVLTKFLLGDYKMTDSQGELKKKIETFDLMKRFRSCGIGKKIAQQERRRELIPLDKKADLFSEVTVVGLIKDQDNL